MVAAQENDFQNGHRKPFLKTYMSKALYMQSFCEGTSNLTKARLHSYIHTCMITAICTLLHLINSTINVLKQFCHFNALVVSHYMNIWKSVSK